MIYISTSTNFFFDFQSPKPHEEIVHRTQLKMSQVFSQKLLATCAYLLMCFPPNGYGY